MRRLSPLLRLIYLLSITCVVTLLSCNDETTKPPPIVDEEPEDTTTTSHDFQFQVFTLGDGASMLRDVAIINDTLAYAVGIINVKDSTGQIIRPPYNLAKWNGKKWDLTRVAVKYPPDGTTAIVHELRGVMAFSEKDVLVSVGTAVMKWDGQSWDILGRLWAPGGVDRLWGRSSKDFYGVGGSGDIAHWNGYSWEKIESGTTLTMQDIWGAYNPKIGKDEILCLASDKYGTLGKRILQLEDETTVKIDTSGLSLQLGGLWFVPNKRYYTVGTGVYWKKFIGNPESWTSFKPPITYWGSHSIRGNAWNDIVVAGSNGEVVHFNGKTWENYFSVSGMADNYYRLDIKGDVFIAVGGWKQKGRILVGRR